MHQCVTSVTVQVTVPSISHGPQSLQRQEVGVDEWVRCSLGDDELHIGTLQGCGHIRHAHEPEHHQERFLLHHLNFNFIFFTGLLFLVLLLVWVSEKNEK